VQQSLDAPNTISVVAGEHAGLRDSGLADHPSINAMGYMQHSPTVEQVMHMGPFEQALHRKREEWQELAQTLVLHSDPPLSYRSDAQPDDLSAGEDLRKIKQKGNSPRRPGLSASGEETSAMLNHPLPPLYQSIMHSKHTASRTTTKKSAVVGPTVSTQV